MVVVLKSPVFIPQQNTKRGAVFVFMSCTRLARSIPTKFNKLIDINYFLSFDSLVCSMAEWHIYTLHTFLIEWKREHVEISARLYLSDVCSIELQ